MAKRKPVADKPTKRGPVDPRESRSRGYEAGYEGLPIEAGDGSEAWREGWRDAIKATGGKLPTAGPFE